MCSLFLNVSRDLHWGNVLVEEISADETLFYDDYGVCVKGEGIRATIIDFTLARCEHGENYVEARTFLRCLEFFHL
jgi:hypothetical protein